MAAPVRPLRRTLCFLRSLGRSDEHGWDIPVFLPGCPARRVGPLHAQQRHFSGYSFGAKRVPLRSLFVFAPQGALSSFEDETCEDKRYSPAVSHPLRSAAKQKSHCRFKQPRQRHSVCPCRPCGAAGDWLRVRMRQVLPRAGFAPAAILPVFPFDRWIGIVQQAKNIRALITYFDQRTGGEPQDFEWNLKNLQIYFRL